MQSVTIRKSGISPDQAADMIRSGLGDGYKIEVDAGTGAIQVRKGLAWASVDVRDEGSETVFEVRGKGFLFLMIMIDNAGIAKRTAAAIAQAAE